MSGNGIDQPSRESDRVPIEAQVDLEFETFQGFLSEYSANISLGGMFVRAADPPPVGTVLRFSLKLKGDFNLVQGRGEVVWNRTESQGPEKPAGLGIRFLDLEPASADLIRRMVDRYRVQGGRPFEVGGSPSAAPAAPAAEVLEAPPGKALRDDIFIPPDVPVPAAGSEGGGDRPAPPVSETLPRSPTAPPPRRRQVRAGTVFLVLGAALAGGLLAHFGERLVHWITGYDLALAERVVYDIPPPASLESEPAQARAVTAGGDAAAPEPARALTPAEVGVTDLGPSAAAGELSPAPAPDGIEPPGDGPRIVFGEGYGAATEALNRIRLITWKEAAGGGGTVVTLWGNGSLRREDLVRVRLGGAAARELVKLRGIDWPFRDPTLEVDSSEVRRIRTGFHPKNPRNELHVVVDLRDSTSRLQQVKLDERSVELFFD